MNVSISVGGKFHAFELAHQLEKRGALQSLITSYPRFAVTPYGVPSHKIHSLLAKEFLQRSWSHLPRLIRNRYNTQYFLHEVFDRGASKKIEPCDLFVGFSSFALHSLRRAKQLGAKVVIERGGSHMLYQQSIMREEYEITGVPAGTTPVTHQKIIEKEIQEYTESDRISVPSIYAKHTFLEQGFPEAKILHIPYGVDLSLFRQTKKRDNTFRIVFAGGLTLAKGVHYLLQAFSEISLPDAELHLIGPVTESMKPFLKKYEGSYRRSDYFPMDKLAEVYSQGSVFAFLSLDDGFGLVIPQAMACGLPVIATDHTGAPDIIRDGVEGFIIPIRDVNACKEKLLFLYENPTVRDEMGKAARARVQAGFSWDDYGEKIINEYECILERAAEKKYEH